MKVGIIGDSHGNWRFLVNTIDRLAPMGVQHAILLGDFGIFPAYLDTHEFLDKVNEALTKNHMQLVAVRGNHDSTDYWRWHLENMPTKHRNAYIRSNILITPDLNHWKWDGKVIFTVNGAISIDADQRVAMERNRLGPRTLYWPDEAITDEMVNSVEKVNTEAFKVDYLFSHECSDKTLFRGRLKPDWESKANRYRMDRILNHLRPKMHFHGHMHNKYEWENNIAVRTEGGELIEMHWTKTFGLECDGMWNSWGVLDTATDEFLWRGEK